jgi:hypothetical protein
VAAGTAAHVIAALLGKARLCLFAQALAAAQAGRFIGKQRPSRSVRALVGTPTHMAPERLVYGVHSPAYMPQDSAVWNVAWVTARMVA